MSCTRAITGCNVCCLSLKEGFQQPATRFERNEDRNHRVPMPQFKAAFKTETCQPNFERPSQRPGQHHLLLAHNDRKAHTDTVLYSQARNAACHSRLRLRAAFVLASSAGASAATAKATPMPTSPMAAAGVAATAATATAALRLGVAAFLLLLPLTDTAAQLHMGHACTSCCLAGQCCRHNNRRAVVVTGSKPCAMASYQA